MAKPIPLDEQIITVLTQPAESSTAEIVLTQAEEKLRALSDQADTLDNDSLSPLLSSSDANDKRRRANDLHFESNRMDASVSALRQRIDDLKRSEQEAVWKAECDAALQERDTLAAEIAEQYPAIVRAMASWVQRIHASDARCEAANIRECLSAEAMARKVPRNFYMENQGEIIRFDSTRLPMPIGGGRAWETHGGGWHYPGLDA